MRFKPVNFGEADLAIHKANLSYALELAPATATVALAEQGQDADAVAGRDRFNVADVPNNLEVCALDMDRSIRAYQS
ncbi:MAG: hypothetical protein HC910_13300 [Spirulinaceae cyanobacterium SM2_1_0]|nr:hypothetical protein [Spirulinaceae cyanobacterium SM2_1_0]